MTTIINQFGDLVKQKGFNPELNNKKLPRANKIISAFPFVKPTNPTPPKPPTPPTGKARRRKHIVIIGERQAVNDKSKNITNILNFPCGSLIYP